MKLAYDRDRHGIFLLPFGDTTLFSAEFFQCEFYVKTLTPSSIDVIFVLRLDFYLIIMIPFVFILNRCTVRLKSVHILAEAKSAKRGV